MSLAAEVSQEFVDTVSSGRIHLTKVLPSLYGFDHPISHPAFYTHTISYIPTLPKMIKSSQEISVYIPPQNFVPNSDLEPLDTLSQLI